MKEVEMSRWLLARLVTYKSLVAYASRTVTDIAPCKRDGSIMFKRCLLNAIGRNLHVLERCPKASHVDYHPNSSQALASGRGMWT